MGDECGGIKPQNARDAVARRHCAVLMLWSADMKVTSSAPRPAGPKADT